MAVGRGGSVISAWAARGGQSGSGAERWENGGRRRLHLQDPGDVAGPGAAVSEFHDLLPRGVGQRPPVDEHPAELVHAAVTCGKQSAHHSTLRSRPTRSDPAPLRAAQRRATPAAPIRSAPPAQGPSPRPRRRPRPPLPGRHRDSLAGTPQLQNPRRRRPPKHSLKAQNIPGWIALVSFLDLPFFFFFPPPHQKNPNPRPPNRAQPACIRTASARFAHSKAGGCLAGAQPEAPGFGGSLPGEALLYALSALLSLEPPDKLTPRAQAS